MFLLRKVFAIVMADDLGNTYSEGKMTLQKEGGMIPSDDLHGV